MATIAETLAIAVQHHEAGRLQLAEQIYRHILTLDANHVDALHLLGVVASQVGNYDVSVEFISRAIQLNATDAALHNSLAGAFMALNRLDEAVTCYQQALDAVSKVCSLAERSLVEPRIRG